MYPQNDPYTAQYRTRHRAQEQAVTVESRRMAREARAAARWAQVAPETAVQPGSVGRPALAVRRLLRLSLEQ